MLLAYQTVLPVARYDRDIERYVKECEVCIEASAVKHGNIMSLKLPSCLWLEVEADIFIFKGQLYPFQ